MQQNLKKALIASIILLICTFSFGQRKKKSKFLEGLKIQPKAGINMFYGDLVSEKRTKYTLGIAAEKEFMWYLNGRLDISYGSMHGTQLYANTSTPYAYFDNNYIHFNVGASFRPLDLALGLFKQRRFNPYVIGQIGAMQHSTTEYYGPASIFNDGTVWREVNTITPTFSLGGGVSIFSTSRVSINAEFIASYAFGDKIDGHDEWYTYDVTGTVDPNNPSNNTITSVHQTDGNDFFYVGTIGVSYLFSDSQWKNSPKYNRKAYLRTRSLYKVSTKKYKRPSRRKTKRYRSR